jgi:hypothetical protein
MKMGKTAEPAGRCRCPMRVAISVEQPLQCYTNCWVIYMAFKLGVRDRADTSEESAHFAVKSGDIKCY